MAATNLLTVTGYLIQTGLLGRGDWMAVIPDFGPVIAWKLALVLSGTVLYWQMLRALARRAGRFGNLGPVMFTAYCSCGAASLLSGAFNPQAASLFWRNAAAQSFLGLIGLLAAPRYARQTDQPSPAITANLRWLVSGALVGVVYVFVLGPGIQLR